MAIDWSQQLLGSVASGKESLSAVKSSLSEFLTGKSKAFKQVSDLLFNSYNELLINPANTALYDEAEYDAHAGSIIDGFNDDNGTNFSLDTPVFNSDGTVYDLRNTLTAFINMQDGEDVEIVPIKGTTAVTPDDLMVDLSDTIQKNSVLISAIEVSDTNELNITDLFSAVQLKHQEITPDAKAYISQVFLTMKDPGMPFLDKMNALIFPNLQSADSINDDPNLGIVMVDLDMDDYTGASPFEAWKQDVDLDFSNLGSSVVSGVKAIGSGLSWIGKMVGKGVKYVADKVDDNVISAKDFGVADINSTDAYFDVPALQIDITGVDPQMFTDSVLFSSYEKHDKLMRDGDFKEIPTFFGGILFNVQGSELILQIYLTPSAPFTDSTPTTLFPNIIGFNDTSVKTLWIAESEGNGTIGWLINKCLTPSSFDFTAEHSDAFWFESLKASKIRMQWFLYLLGIHGDYQPTYLEWSGDFTNSDLINMRADFCPHTYTVYDASGTYDLVSRDRRYQFFQNYTAIQDYVVLENPTNESFLVMVNGGIFTRSFTPTNLLGDIKQYIDGIANLLTLNSSTGMSRATAVGRALPSFIPYHTRRYNVSPRFSVNTDSENGEVINKIIIGVVIVAAVVTAAYFGIKIRRGLRRSYVGLSTQALRTETELSGMSVDNPARLTKIDEFIKIKRKMKKVSRVSGLMGLGVTSLSNSGVPLPGPDSRFTGLFSGLSTQDNKLITLQNRVG